MDQNNDQHPNKRRKLNNSSEVGQQSENHTISTTNINETANMAIDEDEKSNNLTKRALFKEKLSDINIENQNASNLNLLPSTAPNPQQTQNQNQNLNHHQQQTQIQQNTAPNPSTNDNPMHNEQINTDHEATLDWFGNEENNPLNANHGADDEFISNLAMFPMGMTDDMKDIGLNSFMFNGDGGLNLMNMMENGPSTNSNTNNNAANHQIKQENNMLPPDIGGNGFGSNHNSLPPPNNVGQSGYPGFSISASPPAASPMFMDTIHPNNNHNNNYYGLDNGHNQFGDIQHHNNLNNNNNNNHNQFGDGSNKRHLFSLNNGANTVRPDNLPHLRGTAPSQSNMDNGTNINNLNSNVHHLKYSKSDPNHNNINNMNHILTPFDYPLSNPTINTSSGAVNHCSHNYYAQYISQQTQQRHKNNKNNPNNPSSTNIKQENNHKEIHSAPLYSIHSISSSLHNTNSNNSISSHSTHSNNNNNTAHSLSATPTKGSANNYNHFSLSSSLLNIPSHLTQTQHPSFSHSNSQYGPGNGYKHGNDGYNDQNNFNFLWWYPEIAFQKLDPHLVQIP